MHLGSPIAILDVFCDEVTFQKDHKSRKYICRILPVNTSDENQGNWCGIAPQAISQPSVSKNKMNLQSFSRGSAAEVVAFKYGRALFERAYGPFCSLCGWPSFNTLFMMFAKRNAHLQPNIPFLLPSLSFPFLALSFPSSSLPFPLPFLAFVFSIPFPITFPLPSLSRSLPFSFPFLAFSVPVPVP